jgi:hypothetical protein
MLGVNVSGLTGGFLGTLVVAGQCSVDGSLSCPMCTSYVVITDSQGRGEKNRVNGHTVLEILFANCK